MSNGDSRLGRVILRVLMACGMVFAIAWTFESIRQMRPVPLAEFAEDIGWNYEGFVGWYEVRYRFLYNEVEYGGVVAIKCDLDFDSGGSFNGGLYRFKSRNNSFSKDLDANTSVVFRLENLCPEFDWFGEDRPDFERQIDFVESYYLEERRGEGFIRYLPLVKFMSSQMHDIQVKELMATKAVSVYVFPYYINYFLYDGADFSTVSFGTWTENTFYSGRASMYGFIPIRDASIMSYGEILSRSSDSRFAVVQYVNNPVMEEQVLGEDSSSDRGWEGERRILSCFNFVKFARALNFSSRDIGTVEGCEEVGREFVPVYFDGNQYVLDFELQGSVVYSFFHEEAGVSDGVWHVKGNGETIARWRAFFEKRDRTFLCDVEKQLCYRFVGLPYSGL